MHAKGAFDTQPHGPMTTEHSQKSKVFDFPVGRKTCGAKANCKFWLVYFESTKAMTRGWRQSPSLPPGMTSSEERFFCTCRVGGCQCSLWSLFECLILNMSTNFLFSSQKNTNSIGMDDQSWGLSYKGTVWHNGTCRQYCEPFYENNTNIGILLNLYAGTLTFFKNGINLGVAFKGWYCFDIYLFRKREGTCLVLVKDQSSHFVYPILTIK